MKVSARVFNRHPDALDKEEKRQLAEYLGLYLNDPRDLFPDNF